MTNPFQSDNNQMNNLHLNVPRSMTISDIHWSFERAHVVQGSIIIYLRSELSESVEFEFGSIINIRFDSKFLRELCNL